MYKILEISKLLSLPDLTQDIEQSKLLEYLLIVPNYQHIDIKLPELLDTYSFYLPYTTTTIVEEPVQNDQDIYSVPQGEEVDGDKSLKKNLTQSKNNSLIDNIINTARLFVGSKYIWGGKSPKSGGFDCSGLLYYAYTLNGVKIPGSTSGIFTTGEEVSLKNIRPGDIICTKGNGPTGRHVKMVSKIVNGVPYVVEAKGRKYGIVEQPLKQTNNITTIRRIIPSAKNGMRLINKNTNYKSKIRFI